MTVLTKAELEGFTTPASSPGWQRVLDSHRELLSEYSRAISTIYALEVKLQEHGIAVDSPMMVSWTAERVEETP